MEFLKKKPQRFESKEPDSISRVEFKYFMLIRVEYGLYR